MQMLVPLGLDSNSSQLHCQATASRYASSLLAVAPCCAGCSDDLSLLLWGHLYHSPFTLSQMSTPLTPTGFSARHT